MIRRRISTVSITAIAIVLLVALIAFVTKLAWDTINESELEQFQTSQLQLATSLSQEAQFTFTTLASAITRLTLTDEIESTSPALEDDALAFLEGEIADYPEGWIRSIARFDEEGQLRYAYLVEAQAWIPDLPEDELFIYSVPDQLLAITREGDRVISDLSPEIHVVSRNDNNLDTVLLIAPVDAQNRRTDLVNRQTEWIAFELDLSEIFSTIFTDIDLGDEGQLWVLDGEETLQYSARPTPTIDSIRDAFAPGTLTIITDPLIETYAGASQTRLAAIAPAASLDQNFVLFLSRGQTEPRDDIMGSLGILLAFSGVAMLSVIGLGSMFILRIGQESRARQAETQRRQALRGLLQISHALNSSLDLSVVLKRILSELGRLIGHDSASILLIEDQELRTAAHEGAGVDQKDVLAIDEARAAREVIARGYAIVINDTSRDSRWSTGASSHLSPIQSWLGVPLRVREQLVGVLNINSHEKNHFTEEDAELAEAFADQASVALQNARLHELEVKQIEQELTIARGIQQSLLPDAPVEMPEITLLASSLPAQQVSGDYYQYMLAPNGDLLIAIGDVQGKGIPAALMMAVIMTAMRDEAVRHQEPSELLGAMNERLLDRMKRNHMNTALILATYDPVYRQIAIANAGMVQPYIRRNGESKFDFVPVGGYPLGVSESVKYTAKTLDFLPGSILVFFSDGVVEAQNSDGEFFGFERVEALLDDLPEDASVDFIIDRILMEVQAHLGELSPQDDTTILVLRALEAPERVVSLSPDDEFSTEPLEVAQGALPQPEPEPQPATETPEVAEPEPEPVAAAPVHISYETLTRDDFNITEEIEEALERHIPTTGAPSAPRRNVELFLPSQLGFEKIARGAVEAMAMEVGFPEEQIEDIKTAVAEACMNAIEHGNAEDLNRAVSVLISASEESLEVRVVDTGKKSLDATLPEPGLGDMRGYGLFFMSQLVDEFEIKHLPEGGNLVFMASYIRSDENGTESES